SRGPHRESSRLGKAGGPGGEQFQQVDRIANFARARHAEGVGFPVQIQAGHCRQTHPRVEKVGVWLPGEHLNVMTELHQTVAEMAHVDALSAAMGLTTVGQQGNSHTQLFFAGKRSPTGTPQSTAINALANTVTANWTCVQTIVRSAN